MSNQCCRLMDQTITGASLVSCFGEPRITGFKGALYFTLTALFSVDLAFCLTYEWHDFIKRLLTLKEMALVIFCTGGYFAHLNMISVENEYIFKYLKYVDEPYHSHSSKKLKLINEMNAFIKWLSAFSTRAFKFLYMFAAVLPLVHIVIVLARTHFSGKKLDEDNFPLVMHFYVPLSLRTIPGYFLANLAASIWYALSLYIWSIVFKIFVIGLGCLCTEMDLLFEAVNEIDHIPPAEETTPSKTTNETMHVNEILLKRKFNAIIEHHQDITKTMKLMNRMFQTTIVLFLNVYCLQLCLYIVFVMKLEDIVQRIKFATLYIFALYLQYQYASCSQRIKDRGETFGETLYGCGWVDKPQWMKKMLLIMKCMADQPLVMKPYGWYVVDRVFMANIFKATYTYLNVVNEFIK
ncbi:hypothetical protein LSTR_LSTR000115 [Laodelphax striatellus]|uniref:Odorant receptor n=1 Tax=Laodelphax striatellus TaxID=195883 RepID=A0A482X7W8_LAOST|nr:hypothetical protein LSTR_LSTR000115 [Laodelphax striatellus]